jgi:TP901 family phage tail tape measure protein
MSARADISAGRAFVSLHVKQDQFTRGLQQARQRLSSLGSELMGIGTRMTAMGTAIAAPFVFATKTFADFDDQMRLVGAVAGASETQLASMTAVAEELGRTTSYTAAQVASLMAELGRGGFSPDQINEMTGAVLNLARATGTDAATSAAIVTATVNQFGMAAGEAARVADVLTQAANATNSSVEGLGESLQYAGPVAKDLGMSLEETVAILGTLGNAGIQGSEAGTALRRLGVIAASEGDKLKEVFNVSNVDASGKIKPLVQLLGEIGDATTNLDVADRTAKFNEAFGLLGITAASVLSRTSAATQQLTTDLMGAAGTAKTAAAEMDAGIGGAFRIILSAAEGVRLAIGRALEGAIRGVAKTATDFLGVATEWIGKNQGVVASFAAMSAAAITVGTSMIALGVTMKATAAAAVLLGPAFRAAAIVASAAWSAVKLPLTALALQSKITSAIFMTAWNVASRAIVTAWRFTSTAISTAMTTFSAAASAALIATVWTTTAVVIGVAFLGLGSVLGIVAAAVTNVWAVAGGTITAAWVASAGVIGSVWTLVSGKLAILAAAATTAWLSGGGIIGVAIAAIGALFDIIGIKGTISAGLVGSAWATGGALASAAWSVFTAVISSALTPALLLAIAGFSVQIAWAAAWAVITSPILPFIALMGAAVAVVGMFAAQAAIATVKSTNFNSSLGAIRGTLGSLAVAAQKTGNVLLGALKVGDYDIAWKGAMAGVKLAIAEGLIGGQELFVSFFNSIMNMLRQFSLEFAINMALLFEAATKPWKRDEMIGALAQRLTNFNISAGMTFDTGKMKSEAEKELERLQKLLDDRAAQAAADEITGKDLVDNASEKKSDVESLRDQGKITDDEAVVRIAEIEKELKDTLNARMNARDKALASKEIEKLEVAAKAQKIRVNQARERGEISAPEAEETLKAIDKELAAKKAELNKQVAARAAARSDEVTPGQSDEIDEATKAHEREIQAIREKIAVLREGEEAAERMRLKKEGLNDAEIEGIMGLRAEEQRLQAERDKSQMRADAIAKIGDAMIEAGQDPKDVLAEEQKLIEEERQKGLIDDQTAKKAMADAELRAMQRDLDKGVDAMRKRLGLDKEANVPDSQGPRQPLSSVATFSSSALLAQSRGGAESQMVRKMDEHIRLTRDERKQRREEHREMIQAMKDNQGIKIE